MNQPKEKLANEYEKDSLIENENSLLKKLLSYLKWERTKKEKVKSEWEIRVQERTIKTMNAKKEWEEKNKRLALEKENNECKNELIELTEELQAQRKESVQVDETEEINQNL